MEPASFHVRDIRSSETQVDGHRYNVTPSAAYQYAPAYRYYADKISVLHFIGTGKPWQNLAARPAGATSQHSDPFGCEWDSSGAAAYRQMANSWIGGSASTIGL